MVGDIVRMVIIPFFGVIDSAIYGIVSWAYELLIKIASLNLFEPAAYDQFNRRIYTLLGLFMLFKISFSLIKYIINPDEFNDKSKGGKRIILNVLIVLVLIVGTPFAFNMARELQQAIISNNVIGDLILGMNPDKTQTEQQEAGKKVSFMIFNAFYRLSPSECSDLYEVLDSQSDGDYSNNSVYQNCVKALDSRGDSDDDTNSSNTSGVGGSAIVEAYASAVASGDVENLVNKEVNGEKLYMVKLPNGNFAISYYGLTSSIAGGVVGWIFFLFCFDIAIRLVKFAFLQLIAPIPIVSYIDPDSSKNGMFSRWVKECLKTYLDLFIRLAAVFFAIYMISILRGNNSLENFTLFEKSIIVIGVLLFAKQVPKLVQDLFGFKSDLKFSLSLSDRLRQTPIVGKAGVMAGGALGGAYAGYKAGKEVGQRGIFSGFLGAMTGANQMRDKVSMMGAQAGSKPVHAYGNSMNSVFKQMTNREMTNLNPVNMVAAHSVQNRLKQVKAARNEAMDRLSAAQVTQQAAYNQVQNSAGALNRLDEASRGQFMGAIDAYTRNAKTLTDSKATNDQKAEARRTMNTIRDRVQATYTGDFQDVANHFNDRVAAIEATSVVSSINKDIEDLSKEKSQIERFGHIDSASSRDVNSLLNRYQVPERQEPDLQEPGRQEPISTVRQSDDGLYQTDSGIITGGSPGAVNRAFQNRNSGNGSNR